MMTKDEFKNCQIGNHYLWKVGSNIWIGKIIKYDSNYPIIKRIYSNMKTSENEFPLAYFDKHALYWNRLYDKEEINKYYKLMVFE